LSCARPGVIIAADIGNKACKTGLTINVIYDFSLRSSYWSRSRVIAPDW
jgi:hypothetical protein